MLAYSIEEVATELMFTTDELREIYEIYIEEAIQLLPDCYGALAREDYIEFSQIMHGFKGASANLRMKKIVEIAEELEQKGKKGGGAEMALELPKIQKEIDIMKAYIIDFYGDFNL